MKKQYISPLTLTIQVATTPLCDLSVEGKTVHPILFDGDADEGEEGVRRSHSVWDEEEDS